MTHSHMRKILTFAVLTLAALASELSLAAQQQTIIPAYFYPGPLWDQAIAAGPTVSTMIMNPASGPGSARNIDYVNVVTRAQAAGINVIGYVHTLYGARDPQLVKQEVDAYYSWYGVDGIFFDEVASSAAQLAYYDSICAHVRLQAGSPFVVLNPGVYPDEGYVTLADVLI